MWWSALTRMSPSWRLAGRSPAPRSKTCLPPARLAPGADVELYDRAAGLPVTIADEADTVEVADAGARLAPDQPSVPVAPVLARPERAARRERAVAIRPARRRRAFQRVEILDKVWRVRRRLATIDRGVGVVPGADAIGLDRHRRGLDREIDRLVRRLERGVQVLLVRDQRHAAGPARATVAASGRRAIATVNVVAADKALRDSDHLGAEFRTHADTSCQRAAPHPRSRIPFPQTSRLRVRGGSDCDDSPGPPRPMARVRDVTDQKRKSTCAPPLVFSFALGRGLNFWSGASPKRFSLNVVLPSIDTSSPTRKP